MNYIHNYANDVIIGDMSFMSCTACQVLFEWPHQEIWEG